MHANYPLRFADELIILEELQEKAGNEEEFAAILFLLRVSLVRKIEEHGIQFCVVDPSRIPTDIEIVRLWFVGNEAAIKENTRTARLSQIGNSFFESAP
jgi:hypothetical protein